MGKHHHWETSCPGPPAAVTNLKKVVSRKLCPGPPAAVTNLKKYISYRTVTPLSAVKGLASVEPKLTHSLNDDSFYHFTYGLTFHITLVVLFSHLPSLVASHIPI
ncbi:hypothetical protein J6590_045095 [Homalodisca vitripennis]|nr:hypothetical protein J6590_045095 [Homalodisca vitripennis]